MPFKPSHLKSPSSITNYHKINLRADVTNRHSTDAELQPKQIPPFGSAGPCHSCLGYSLCHLSPSGSDEMHWFLIFLVLNLGSIFQVLSISLVSVWGPSRPSWLWCLFGTPWGPPLLVSPSGGPSLSLCLSHRQTCPCTLARTRWGRIRKKRHIHLLMRCGEKRQMWGLCVYMHVTTLLTPS